MVARPRADRWHKKPTALLGGVGIFAGVLAGAGFYWSEGTWLIAGGVFAFLLGLADDIWRIGPREKLLGQVAAALLLLLSGSKLPWSGLAILDYAISFVWIIGITNAINLLDNMDGLAAGVSLSAAAVCAILLWQLGQTDWMVLAGSVAAALGGFLFYNSNPASIFMGDSGALFIGYVLSAVSLRVADQVATRESCKPLLAPVLILLVPLFDTTFVTIQRKLAGRPVSQGGRDHTSHRLVALGWSERAAVWILYGLAIGSGAGAILAANSSGDAAWTASYLCGCVVIFLGIHLAAVVTYSEAEFQDARQKNVWIACWWRAVDWRLLERILDACAFLLVWRWDSRLTWGTASVTQHSLLVGSSFVFIKIACLSGLGVYRDSWGSISSASLVRVAKALVLAELVSLPILLLTPVNIGGASLIAGLDLAFSLGTCLALRFTFQSMGVWLRQKQS
jgi:UDP-GlcNAc:undecaprenyl-phosphate GlcNAc-1-phosphate transferase